MYYDFLFNTTFTAAMQRFMFPVHLLLSAFLLVLRTKRKRHFALRLTLSLIVVALLAYAWPVLNYGLHCANFVVQFCAAVGLVFFCYDLSFKNALFACAAAYAMQHILDAFGEIVMTPFNQYLPDFWTRYAVTRIPIVAAYVPMYFLFVRKFWKQEEFIIESKRLTAVVAIVLLSALTLNLVEIRFVAGAQTGLRIICRIYRIICCTLSLALQSGMFTIGRLERDKEILEHLRLAEKKQQRESSENIELINMKVHDIKHQLNIINSMKLDDKSEYYKELESAVSIYDKIAKTGNDSLDVVITEKNLICEKYNIKLSYIVDGATIAFIASTDIYSLFGNALDNAIESVRKVADPEKRVISIRVDAKGKFLRIIAENWCDEPLTFEDGLPITTKKDAPGYHGYGVKSMKYIVEKYGGFLNPELKDNIFRLKAVIPLPEKL